MNMTRMRVRKHGLVLGLAWMCLLAASPKSLAAEIKFIGEDKLKKAESGVPNMLARKNLKAGQWIEAEMEPKVIPRGPVPTETEQFMMQMLQKTSRSTVRTVRVTEDELITDAPESRDRSRGMFSKEDWEKTSTAMGKKLGYQVKTIRVKDVTVHAKETVSVGGKRLECGKASIVMEIEGRSVLSESDSKTEFKLTWWFHESIPMEGHAKSLIEYSMRDKSGNPFQFQVSKQTIDYSPVGE